MNLDRKKVGLAIIAFGALALIGIVYILFFHQFNQEAVTEGDVVTEGQTETQKIRPTEIDARVVAPEPVKKAEPKAGEPEIRQIAYSFAERFGSYSNQSTFQNMLDLKTVMTPKMAKWVDDYVSQQVQAKNDSSVYKGITTKTVSVKLIDFNSGDEQAVAQVSTQRREATGETSNASSYGQVLRLNFVKVGDSWLVDEARWQAEKLK